ncbi:MAG: hypothetical protein AABX70_01725 [Nanoarchaeota archaeon]
MGHGKRTKRKPKKKGNPSGKGSMKASGGTLSFSSRSSLPLEAKASSPSAGGFTDYSRPDSNPAYGQGSSQYTSYSQVPSSTTHRPRFPVASLATAVAAFALTAASYYGAVWMSPKIELARKEAAQVVEPVQAYLDATFEDPSIARVQRLPGQIQLLYHLLPVNSSFSSNNPKPFYLDSLSLLVSQMLQRAQEPFAMYSSGQPMKRDSLCEQLLPELRQEVGSFKAEWVDYNSVDLRFLRGAMVGAGGIVGLIGLCASGVFVSGLKQRYFPRSDTSSPTAKPKNPW